MESKMYEKREKKCRDNVTANLSFDTPKTIVATLMLPMVFNLLPLRWLTHTHTFCYTRVLWADFPPPTHVLVSRTHQPLVLTILLLLLFSLTIQCKWMLLFGNIKIYGPNHYRQIMVRQCLPMSVCHSNSITTIGGMVLL